MMTYRVLVLISQLNEYRLDNHSIIPNALLRCGYTVGVGDIETLGISDNKVVCDSFVLDREYSSGVPFPEMKLSRGSAEEFDLIWVLANPHPDLLMDTYELLWVLNERVPFVNRASSMLMLNSKIALPSVVERANLPEQHVSNSFDVLDARVKSEPGSSWVLKPSNEGCGADVYFVNAEEPNYRAIMQSVTGNEVSRHEMYGKPTIGLSRKYVTMQRLVPEVTQNEKRVMLSGGIPFCGFDRTHDSNDHRANVTLGTEFSGLLLTAEEEEYSREIGEKLMEHGIFFAGIDLAHPYVLELNLANPGGLNYSYRATGKDQSVEAVELLVSALEKRGVLALPDAS